LYYNTLARTASFRYTFSCKIQIRPPLREPSMSPHVLKTIYGIIFAVLTGICLPGSIMPGSIYSWTDAGGIKHFSNIAPPQEGEAQRLKEENFELPRGHRFKVIKIFDGDTVRVKGFGLKFTIRLAGIDTPELGKKGQHGQPYSRQAKQKLTRLIDKKIISLKQYGTGSYNRVIAEIFMGITNINLEMVRSGLAEVYQGKPPRGLDTALYLQAEKQARDSLKGMWVQGIAYMSPRQWRRIYTSK